MRIRFTRLSNDRHALEIVRPSGPTERIELETRSFLLHDLIHYAVESEAGLKMGVWGTLASGTTLAELNGKANEQMGEQTNDRMGERASKQVGEGLDKKSALMAIELVTGPLQGVVQGRASVEGALGGITQLLAAEGASPPPWLSREFIARVLEKMRQLMGRFRATPFGQTMELSWP